MSDTEIESEDDFSVSDLQLLIDSALKNLESKKIIPLSYNDSKLLEKLYEILPTYVGSYSDSQYIISQLRNEIYENTTQLTVQQLHTITHNCTRCELASDKARIPLWNINDPDLVIIIDNPTSLDYQKNIDILVQSLQAAGFSSTRVCLTYATRCPMKVKQITATEYTNCSSYLYHEIHAMQPKLIVTLGQIPYAVLTGSTLLKLVKEEICWLGIYPILPLYTIGYMETQSQFTNVSAIQYFTAQLQQAYTFTYGDH